MPVPGARAPRWTEESRKTAIFSALCIVVALAPLPLGSERPLAWSMLGLAVGALLAATVFSSFRDLATFQRDLVVPLGLFGVVVVVILLQMTSWTPSSWHNPIWDEASEALGRSLSGAISVDPYLAAVYVLRLLTYAGVFFIAVVLSGFRSCSHRVEVGCDSRCGLLILRACGLLVRQ